MSKKEFKAESKRLLDLMINSIYTHKEIFLREIISNASDAIDKLCYLSLTDDKVGLTRDQFEIRLSIDKERRLLTVSDNGIGMDEADLENNLGVIASSGSLQFRKELEGAESAETDIIGQFGVGFYSAFMVADQITVVTKKYGSDQAYRWQSDGVDGYTIEPCEKDAVGTDVIMHIKPDTEEEKDEYSQYLREYPLYKLVKKYSDYIRFPIRMLMPHPELKEGSTEENPEYEEKFEWDTLNSMIPLWQRKKGDVTKEEYDEFYQQRFSDPNPPLSVITVAAEGAVTYKALLFIPEKAPLRYYSEEYEGGLQLYSAGVMIMDKCAELLPECFNFVRGVVESPDLNLNISRELLQHDRQLKLICANLEKKVKSELERLLRDEREKYESFWQSFGRQLKLSAMDNYGAKKDVLQDLLLFYSSTEKKLTTLGEYVTRMREEQKYIYFASGDTVEAIDHMPQTELLKEHSMEILYFTDKADEFLSDILRTYQDKPFRSVTDGDLELPGEEKKDGDNERYKEAFAFIKDALDGAVDEVKVSTRLKTHPVCLSSGEGVTFEMEKYFKAAQPELGLKAKRILELNVDHPAFLAFETARLTDPEKAKKYARIFYNQAQLIAGLPIDDPSAYTDLLCSLWQ
ncbi:MAG: molecular chaperone HtpG [Clostridiales bacterium]|nr:molecular chaperone HtpG [Clostridiales bacterium]